MNDHDRIEAELERLNLNPTWRGRYWHIHCPFHEDRNKSAQCFEDGWIHCHSGCPRRNISSISNLKIAYNPSETPVRIHELCDFTDLWLELEPIKHDVKGVPAGVLRKLGWREWPDNYFGIPGGAFIPYFNTDRSKVRFYQIRHDLPDRRFTFARGCSPICYGLEVLPKCDKYLPFTEGCVSPDTEVLTKHGWVRFDEYNGEEIAIYDRKNNKTVFEKPSKVINFNYDGDAYEFNHRCLSLLMSPDHRIVGSTQHGKHVEYMSKDRVCSNMRIKKAACLDEGAGLPLTDDEIRLLVAIQADGCLRSNSTSQRAGKRRVYFHFKKDRKWDRLSQLIASYNTHHSITADGYHSILFTLPEHIPYTKEFDYDWIMKMTQHQREVFLKEIPYWDGNFVKNRTMTEYSTTDKHNADFVQTLATLSGVASTLRIKNKPGIRNVCGVERMCKEAYKVTILWGKNDTTINDNNKKKVKYSGSLHCVRVSTEEFFVRRDGHIHVTGNSRDSVILRMCGVPAISIPSASSGAMLKRMERYASEHSLTLVCMGDRDEAGDKLVANLTGTFIDARTPIGKDVGDFYAEKGLEAVKEFYGIYKCKKA